PGLTAPPPTSSAEARGGAGGRRLLGGAHAGRLPLRDGGEERLRLHPTGERLVHEGLQGEADRGHVAVGGDHVAHVAAHLGGRGRRRRGGHELRREAVGRRAVLERGRPALGGRRGGERGPVHGHLRRVLG